MNVSEIFVRRPVMTTLVMVGILVFGIVGYRSLPVAALPNVVLVGITEPFAGATRPEHVTGAHVGAGPLQLPSS